MILTCDNCTTSYSVADDAIGADGRKVKCISCGQVWFQAGSGAESADADTPKATGRRASIGRAAAAAAVLLAVGGLAGGIYAGRSVIVHSWPPAALLYEQIGVGLDGLDLAGIPGVGAGLQYRNIASEVMTDSSGDTLWVRGEVHNVSDIPRPVPTLRVDLAGPDGAPLVSWTFELEVDMVEPGAVAMFETSSHALTEFSGVRVVLGADGATPDRATAVSELAH